VVGVGRLLGHSVDDFLHKLSQETWASAFEGNDVNTNFNTFLNTFLRHFYSSFPMVKANKLLRITSGIRTSCQRKRVLYLKLRNSNNPALKKYLKDYCRILSKVINEAKRLDYDRQILNSNNALRMSWKLMVGVLQIIKLLPMHLIITLQLSPSQLVTKLIPLTVLPQPPEIIRIKFRFP
jgi:hypothetical protein